jgi:hypothetical protein
MTVDILDYIGKHEDGILVLLSIGHEEEYYEASFYYRENFVVLTVQENLEEKLNSKIEDWEGYESLMYQIVTKVVPFKEMINRIDEFNPENYGLYLDNGTQSNT